MLHIYVDGSALNNGKENSKGGYGLIILNDNNDLIYAYRESFDNVTNNQMELKAILKAFELLDTKFKNNQAIIYSDSAYCINILTDWIHIWSKNSWINSKKEQIKNLNIVLSLYEYYKKDFFINQVEFVKVKGHSENLGNEIADALSRADALKFSNLILKNGVHINIE